MLTSPAVTSNVFTPNTLENNTGLLSGSDVISQGWGQHTVTASFTFDGVNASNGTSSLQCHVTGLPFIAAPPQKKGQNAWSIDQENWGAEYFDVSSDESVVYVDNSTGSTIIIGSPVFHLPNDTEIPVDISISAHGDKTWLGRWGNDVAMRVLTSESTYVDFTVAHNNENYPSTDYSTSQLSLMPGIGQSFPPTAWPF